MTRISRAGGRRHDGRRHQGRFWGTVDEALTTGTIKGADASHQEHTRDSITAGTLAGFVMMAGDPHEMNSRHAVTVARLDGAGFD